MLRVQAHCAIFTLVAKLCVASTCAAIAALVLGVDPSYKDDVASLGLPVAIVFVVSYVLAATLLALIDLAVAAGVQGWCLDYKQNCVDHAFKSAETWMMAIELVDEPALLELHELLSSEREHEHRLEGSRGRARVAPAQVRAPARFAALFAAAQPPPPQKSRAQLLAEEEAAAGERRAGERKKGVKRAAEGRAKGKQGQGTDASKDTKKNAAVPAKAKSPTKGKTSRAPSSDDGGDDGGDDDGRERPAAGPSARRRRPGAAATEEGGSPKTAASRERGGEVEEGETSTSTRRGRRADS